MTLAPDAAAIERFRALIAAQLGLQFDESKRGFLADILRRCAAARRVDVALFLEQLAGADAAAIEWRELAQALTVTETYFFRNAAQFAALRDAVTAMAHPVRVLSAGCASGEEPYSIAMSLEGEAAAIRAIDLNAAMLAKAAVARYSAWSLRETSPEGRARWFTQDDNDFLLPPAVRNAVAFEERNLAEDDGGFWRPDAFDIVFCRNVLMYFTPAAARAVIARIARTLVPGGLLFLGHAETLRGLSRDFDLRHTHGTFYYQRKATLSAIDADEVPPDPIWTSLPIALDGATWYEAIESASMRVRSIAARPTPAADLRASESSSAVTRAMALMADEHYAEALDLLAASPTASADNSDTMFLRGVLLMHRGDFAGAERVCTALFMRDGKSAGAHYLMALCREAHGDCVAAALHDRHAAEIRISRCRGCI